MKLEGKIKKAYKVAVNTRKNSYSPYSKQKVGAAIVTKSGRIFGGCNVENSSFGGTVCAERVAIQKAVSEEGELEIESVVVVTDQTPAWTPCGFCRQVIAEFGKNPKIYTLNLDQQGRLYAFKDLLMDAFTPAHLLKPKKIKLKK